MKHEKSTFGWVMEFAGQKKSFYIASVIIAAAGSLCHIVPYFLMAGIIQNLMAGQTDFSVYARDILLMLLFWTLRVVLHSLSTSCSHTATFNVLGNIRRRGLAKLERMPLGDVQNRGSGNLKNILVERIDSIETTLAHVIPEVSGNICVVLVTFLYLLFLNWKMALASLITFPLGMICFMCMMIGYEASYKRTVEATRNLNDTSVEYIGGIEVIKVFGKAKSSYDKFAAAAKEGAQSYIDWMRKSNLYFTVAMVVMPATLITVLPIGGLMVMHGTLSSTDFVQVIILAMGLITPVIGCMAYSDDLAKLGTVMGEITDILTADEMERPEQSKETPKNSDIVLQDVHFGYDEQEVLHGISAEFKTGTVNALVGPSGGGKSTIAKLIASFWDVKSGKISIGGADIRNISMECYHRQVAYVSQEAFLFDTTIRENIRIGRPDATDAEVEQAAKDCGCYDFIMKLENGFDTVAGGGGSHLSGGEKQRICIARAMLKDAPVVILDEATAYTDPENEAIIQASVAKLVKGRTLIVIAHRLSTIMDADQILVINKGNIEDRGTHQHLLESCPLYQSLWQAHISSKDSLDGGADND